MKEKIAEAVQKCIAEEGNADNWPAYLDGESVLTDADLLRIGQAVWAHGSDKLVKEAGTGLLKLIKNLVIVGVLFLAWYSHTHGWFWPK